MTVWVLISRLFSLDWWSYHLQYFIQSLMGCFINIWGQILLSQISFHKFCMFVPTKATVKLINGNTVNSQGCGILLYCFPNFFIICPVGQVYYCPCHPSNTISSGTLKFYVGFQRVTSESLEHCNFVHPQVRSWRSPY